MLKFILSISLTALIAVGATSCAGDTTSNPSPSCPTTSNCGCSGKNKADCNTSCCAWVTGEGCKCR